jgi:hypothetical protein
MPIWVNINDREPALQRNYYVKHGLSKDILPLERIISYAGYADNFFWLDESDAIAETQKKISLVKSVEDLSKIRYEDIAAADTYIHSINEAGKKTMFIKKPVDVIQALNGKYEVTAIANLHKIFGVKAGAKFEEKLFNIKQQSIKSEASKLKI